MKHGHDSCSLPKASPHPNRSAAITRFWSAVTPTAAETQDGSFALDEHGAALVAGLVAEVYGSGAPHSSPAQCRRVRPGLLIGMYQVACTALA